MKKSILNLGAQELTKNELKSINGSSSLYCYQDSDCGAGYVCLHNDDGNSGSCIVGSTHPGSSGGGSYTICDTYNLPFGGDNDKFCYQSPYTQRNS